MRHCLVVILFIVSFIISACSAAPSSSEASGGGGKAVVVGTVILPSSHDGYNLYIELCTNTNTTAVLYAENIIMSTNIWYDFVIRDVAPGKYYIITVADMDNNGAWTPGVDYQGIYGSSNGYISSAVQATVTGGTINDFVINAYTL